jgi:predicted TIM-barrel enzyme
MTSLRASTTEEPLVDAVAQVIQQRDELLRRVEVLNDKLIELSTPLDERIEVREIARRAYRRGAPVVTNPERHARGWMRDLMERGR